MADVLVRGLDDDTNRLINRLLHRLDEKAPRNKLRAGMYDGRHALRHMSAVLPPQYRSLGLVLGWSAKAVDLLARRTTLTGYVWPDGDLDSLGFREVWDGNMLSSEVDQALVSSLIHGTAFAVATRGDIDGQALIHFYDALSATGEWDARLRQLTSLLRISEHTKDGKPSRFVLYLPGRTITAAKDGGWSVVDDRPHIYGMPARPLVYKPRLGRPFGSSRISRPVIALQDRAIAEWLRAEGHMDIYAYPEFWMLGADESIFKNQDGSLKPSWAVMLGRIKGIPDDDDAATPRADVKQFSASDPAPHLAYLNFLAKAFARETSLPDSSLAITDLANPTSAEAYDASQYELIAEAEGAVDDWSSPLRQVMMTALAIANKQPVPPEWASIETRWRDPRYQSRAAQADAGMKQISAAPWLADTEIGLELLGLDGQQIRRAMADKRRIQGQNVLEALTSAANNATTTTAPADGGGDQAA